ncbi:MAG: acyclic terpene utilization AtuA family protein [Acidobacteriota bacterium]
MSGRTLRLGAGAGYSGDRIEPAVELAAHGKIDYLVFECLAERTIALAQQVRAKDARAGFDPLLLDRMRAVLPVCHANRVRIITNMGAANPTGAADAVRALARELGCHGLRVAAVTGDDVLDHARGNSSAVLDTGEPAHTIVERLLSANAYLGIEPLLDALAQGADIIITGRVADPSLFLAPQVHEFGWALNDWNRLGAGTVVGHLLECAGQVTGGYFADPGRKEVEGLARLGFPIAEVSADGTAVITKVSGSGGRVTVATCTEQLLYEIHDPAAYYTPDVVADFSGVRFTDVGTDRVHVQGGRGRQKPATLKVTLGYRDGFIGEGQISYAGAGARQRGELALEIVTERLSASGRRIDELRCDLIGINALHGAVGAGHSDPYEVRVRIAGRASTASDAVWVGNEVEALYTNGPAGGGGATRSVREVLAVASMLLPRDQIRAAVDCREA